MRLKPNSLPLIAVMAAILCLGEMATDIFISSLPTLVAQFDTSIAHAQLTLGVYMIGFALSQLVWGPVSDRYGRKPPLIIGTLLFLLASAAAGLAPSMNALIVLRFLQALGGGSGVVIVLAIIRDMHERDQAASMLARMGTVIGVSPALAPVIGGYLLLWFGWRANFAFLALWAGLTLILILAVVDETLRMRDLHALRARGFARNVLSLLRNRTYLGYGVTMVFAFGTFFAFLFASPFVFIEVLGVKTEHFAYLITVQVVGFVSGTLLADRFMHRIGLERLFSYALALACLAGIGVALPPWLGLASVATIIAPMTVFAFCMGFVFPLGTAAALGPFPHIAGAASSFLGFAQSAVGAGIGVLVGVLHDGTVVPMTTTMGLCILLAVGFYLLLVRGRPLPVEPGSVSIH